MVQAVLRAIYAHEKNFPNLAAWDDERVKTAGSSVTLTRFLV